MDDVEYYTKVTELCDEVAALREALERTDDYAGGLLSHHRFGKLVEASFGARLRAQRKINAGLLHRGGNE